MLCDNDYLCNGYFIDVYNNLILMIMFMIMVFMIIMFMKIVMFIIIMMLIILVFLIKNVIYNIINIIFCICICIEVN